jgi:hypothetical protein
MKGLELSGEDKANIQSALMNPGWKILTDKVWAVYLQALAYRCATQADDHRYNQGFYAGFIHARTLAEKSGEPESPANPGIEASEADLVARKRKSYE